MSEADPAGGPGPEWWFYHLERTGPDEAAGPLVAKCLERGWRVLAVSPSAARRAALDEALWTHDADSFLPHGQADAPGIDPARQPVLIAGDVIATNGAQALLLLDGMEAPVDAPFARCMVMFDGADAETRAIARRQYKDAKAAGRVCKYFQQTPSKGWRQAD